jgi:hypothetical protein
MSDNVVSINKGRDNLTPQGSSQPYVAGSAIRATFTASYNDVPDTHSAPSSDKVLNLQQLYPESSEDSRMLKGLNLIERARLNLRTSLDIDPVTSFFVFDQEIMKTRALLVKAFQFREIGEGYAALVNAVIWALGNREKASPSRRQINVISNSLDRLINGPYMHFDTAMQIMDELEDADLNIEPASLDLLTAELND